MDGKMIDRLMMMMVMLMKMGRGNVGKG